MNRKVQRGMQLLLALVMVLVVSGFVASLIILSTAGSRREASRTNKFISREIAEAGISVSINNLAMATDGKDNDDDGAVDEGAEVLDPADLLVPFGHFDAGRIEELEGHLGRVGTVRWNAAADADGNGRPDFGEAGVEPVPFSGGEFIAWTRLSEADGLDNDGDGAVDEANEAGSVSFFALGRYNGYVSLIQEAGAFADKMGLPNPPPWNPNAAVASAGSLTLRGNPRVQGAGGNVHSNDTLTFEGGPQVAGNATASNGVFGDTRGVAGEVDGTAPQIDRPDARPELLKHFADTVLGADGNVYNASGVLLASGSYKGWKFGVDAATGRVVWTLSGNFTYTGTVFVEGDAKLTGAGSQVAMPVRLSVLATGSIGVQGNGHYVSPLENHVVFLSGGDLRITGGSQSGQQSFQGILLAREQIHQSGNSEINGVIMAADLDDRFGEVSATQVGGGAVVTYDGTFKTDLPVRFPSNRFYLDPTVSAYEER